MIYLLLVGFLGSLVAGALIFVSAKSAVHEIEALLFLLIATVFFCTVAVLEALRKGQ